MGTFTPTQHTFGLFQDNNSNPDNCTLIGTVDVRQVVSFDTNYIFRIGIDEAGNAAGSITPQIQFQVNSTSGTWTVLTTSTSYVKIVGGTPSDGASCATQKLTGAGGSYEAGEYDENGSYGAHTFGKGNYTEFAVCLQLLSADLSNSDIVYFRIVDVDASPNAVTYSLYPSIEAPAGTPTTYYKYVQMSAAIQKQANPLNVNFGAAVQWTTPRVALYLPGESGDYASTPDHSRLRITGDLDIQVYLRVDNWTPTNYFYLVAKTNTSTEEAYVFRVTNTGIMQLVYSTTGTSWLYKNATAALSTVCKPGEPQWLRVTFDVDNGSSQNVATFYTGGSDPTPSWSQLGSTDVDAGTVTINAGTAPLQIGIYPGDTYDAIEELYRVIVKDGIGGTTVFDVDFTKQFPGATSVLEDSNNAVVTINQSGDPQAEIIGTGPGRYVLFDAAVSLITALNIDFSAAVLATLTATVDFDAYLTGVTASYLYVDLDAAIQKAQALQAAMDAAVQKQGNLLTADMDAALAQIFSKTVNLDGAVQDTMSVNANFDGALQQTFMANADFDAAIVAQLQKLVALDAAVTALGLTKSVNLDAAILLQAITKTVNFDAAVTSLGILNVDFDGVLQAVFSKLVNMDAAVLEEGRTVSVDMDAAITTQVQKLVQFGAAILATLTMDVDLDAAIQDTLSLAVDFDASITAAGGSFYKYVDFDAAIQKLGLLKTVQFGAAVLAIYTKAVDLDAAIQATLTKNVSLDGAVQDQGRTKAVNLDAGIQETSTKAVDLDAVLQAVFTNAVDFDAAIQELGRLKTVSMDAAVQDTFTKTADLDAVVSLQGQKTLSLDAAVLATLPLYVAFDGVLAGGAALYVDFDALIAALGITRTVDMDAAIQQLGLTKVVSLDGALQRSRRLGARMDAAVKQEGATKLVSLDAAIWDSFQKTIGFDAAVWAALSKTIGFDASIQTSTGGNYLFVSLDAAVWAVQTMAVSMDAAIVNAYTLNVNFDAAVEKRGRKKPVDFDAALFRAMAALVNFDAAIADNFSLSASFDGRIDYGKHVWMDGLIAQYGRTLTLGMDASLSAGKQIFFDAYILAPTFTLGAGDAERHRLKGDKDAGGEYNGTTQTEVTYSRGLKPGE